MKYRPLNDLIDPDLTPDELLPLDHDPDSPNDAFVIGDNGATVRAPDALANPELDEEQRRRRIFVPLTVLLVVAAVGMTIWNLSNAVQGPPVPPPPAPARAKQALYLGVMRVEAYRRGHGVTPMALTDFGIEEGMGYSYTRIDPAHYVLSFENRGVSQEYDSAVPMTTFFGSPREMLTMGAQGGSE